MTPAFTLLPNEHAAKLDDVFVNGQTERGSDNYESYLEEVKTHIAKDYDGGHQAGFFINVTHTMREEFTPKEKWHCLPPFMRFKESGDVRLYGECAITAREIGNYIRKMAARFDFAKARYMLCVKEDDKFVPVIAGNKKFLDSLVGQMNGYYKETQFVVTEYSLNAG